MRKRRVRPQSKSVTGMYPSGKAACGELVYESAVERGLLLLAELDPTVESIQTQPETLTWTNERGEKRVYSPDLRLVFRSTRKNPKPATPIWIEAKGRELLKTRKGQWQAQVLYPEAKAFLARRGERFRLVAEEELARKPLATLIENADFLLRFCRRPSDRETEIALMALAQGAPGASGLDLIQRFPNDDRLRALASLWRLVSQGWLRMDLRKIVVVTDGVSAGDGELELERFPLPWRTETPHEGKSFHVQ